MEKQLVYLKGYTEPPLVLRNINNGEYVTSTGRLHVDRDAAIEFMTIEAARSFCESNELDLAPTNRTEAVEKTKKLISELTPEKVAKIVGDSENYHDVLVMYANSVGVSGWYYDTQYIKFCNEVLLYSLCLNLLDYYKNKSKK